MLPEIKNIDWNNAIPDRYPSCNVGMEPLKVVSSYWLEFRQWNMDIKDSVNMVSTVPAPINGGLNCKANQKVRYWGDAASIAGDGEDEMPWQQSQSCVWFCV